MRKKVQKEASSSIQEDIRRYQKAKKQAAFFVTASLCLIAVGISVVGVGLYIAMTSTLISHAVIAMSVSMGSLMGLIGTAGVVETIQDRLEKKEKFWQKKIESNESRAKMRQCLYEATKGKDISPEEKKALTDLLKSQEGYRPVFAGHLHRIRRNRDNYNLIRQNQVCRSREI